MSAEPGRTVLPIPEREHTGLGYDSGTDDYDHLIADEERLRVATAIQ